MVRVGDEMVHNKRGQALVEYVLIVALISVITIALVKYFGGYLKNMLLRVGLL